ncbi:MAG: DUF6290 family protein [Synergistaceae bacterium]|nr:DUF6290 family protein [Synergistaceae bacterium]
MGFSIRLTAEERALAESYAKLHSLSIGEAFKSALFEKIEDEYDLTIANEAYGEYLRDGKKSAPIEKLWKELDL